MSAAVRAARRSLPVLLSLPLLAALDCGKPIEEPDTEPPCNPEGELTYEDVRPIFRQHCFRCHNSTIAGEEDRYFSNPDVNFNTEAGATAELPPPPAAIRNPIPRLAVRYLTNNDEVLSGEGDGAEADGGIMPYDELTDPTDEEVECVQRWCEQLFGAGSCPREEEIP